MGNITLLPSSALAKLSLIITENKLTPHPAHPGKVSEWAQTKCEDNFTTEPGTAQPQLVFDFSNNLLFSVRTPTGICHALLW